MSGHKGVGLVGGAGRESALPLRRLLVAAAVSIFLAAPFTILADVRASEVRPAPATAATQAETGAERPVLPVASGVRVVRSGETTRLAFDITSQVEVRAFVMADPNRIIVDLPETIFAVEADAGRAVAAKVAAARGKKPAAEHAPAGLISSYRFGKLGPGRSRIVVDLGAPARIVQAATAVSAEGQLRLLLDLVPTDRASFAAAAAEAVSTAAAPVAAASAPAPAVAADGSKPVVVIDPGHGGIDVGAHIAGRMPEKEIVFLFARALESALLETGRYTVRLTRTEDVFVPLAERVRFAQTANAQLFLSIHADTLNERGVSGATVYTVSDKASDAHAARLAEKENFVDKAAGFDGVEEGGGVSDILFDLTRRETRAYSHVFARTLVNVWREAAKLNKNPIRSAGFKVLKAPDVPSALLELGYVSSEKDAALLADPEWRARTARAVARSIDQFFAMRSPMHASEETGGVASITR